MWTNLRKQIFLTGHKNINTRILYGVGKVTYKESTWNVFKIESYLSWEKLIKSKGIGFTVETFVLVALCEIPYRTKIR